MSPMISAMARATSTSRSSGTRRSSSPLMWPRSTPKAAAVTRHLPVHSEGPAHLGDVCDGVGLTSRLRLYANGSETCKKGLMVRGLRPDTLRRDGDVVLLRAKPSSAEPAAVRSDAEGVVKMVTSDALDY